VCEGGVGGGGGVPTCSEQKESTPKMYSNTTIARWLSGWGGVGRRGREGG